MSKSKSKLKKKPTKPESSSVLLDPSYLADVVKKLKDHPDYKEEQYTDEQWKEEARKLTDPSRLHELFSHLTDEAYGFFATEMGQEAEALTDTEGSLHEREQERAQDRARSRLGTMSKLSVKLLLRECRNTPPNTIVSTFANIFSMTYGPLHAVLQVGDVCVEWDDGSLVIPQRGDLPDSIFQSDVGHETSATAAATLLAPQMNTAINDLNFNSQIDLLFDASVSRKKMIDNLIEVIVKYNRYNEYHLVYRNCQTFVTEAMKAMGIKNAPKLTGKLKEYFTQLKKGKTETTPNEFPTHEALDRYVMSVIQDKTELTQHDKEYLLCMYFQFHLQAMRKAKDPDEECRIGTCQMGKLEKMIDGQPTILIACT